MPRRRTLLSCLLMPSFALSVLAIVAGPLAPQASARPGDPEYVVVKAGTVITGDGKEIENGDIVIEDGVVTLVGVGLDAPRGAEIVSARDQVVMPGMVLPHSRWGLPGYRRNGVKANQSVAREVYPERIDTEPLLRGGYTAVAYYPAGTGLPGSSAVFATGGPEDERLLKAKSYLRVTGANLPADKKTLHGALEKADAEIKKVEEARAEWDKQQAAKEKAEAEKTDAESESSDAPGDQPEQDPQDEPAPDKPDGEGAAEGDEPDHDDGENGEQEGEDGDGEPETFTPPAIDPAHKPIVDLIRNPDSATPMLIEINDGGDLLHLDQVLEDREFEPVYALVGQPGRFLHVVDRLGEREATVLMRVGVGTRPNTAIEFELAGALSRAGCTVGLLPAADSPWGYENVRNVLASMVRQGFAREDALRALTLTPAEVLGVDDEHGSIAKDKRADLVFLTGDPLDPASRVSRVMIEGETVWDREEATR